MIDLPRRYRYTYRLHLFAGHWRHDYQLVGANGGLSLHITDFGENNPHISERYSAGLECHWRQPPKYMADQPPSHDECGLLHAPCWHDGTSLYAKEVLLSLFDGNSHERMFARLVREADERLGGQDD